MKELKEKSHSIRYNFIMNFILTASQFIFPLITFPYVSRVLMAAGNGKVSFVSSVANYFLMIASLGIPTYGIRACAQARDDRKKLSKTVQEIFLINLVMTILVIISYLVCVFTIPRFYADKTLFLIYGINILLNMFGMNWLFQALEKYDYITFRSLAFKILSVILMFLFVHQKEDYVIYGAISVFAAVGSNVLNFIRIHRFVEFKWSGDYEIKRHIKPILILFAQSLAVSIYTNLDTVMLGFMKTDVDVGYYNAAVKIKTILVSLVTSLGNVLLPRMSYYVKKKMSVEFYEIMLKALNFTVMLSIPLVIYFGIYADEAIQFLAGDGYAGAVQAMQIITISVIPIGLTGVLGIQVLTSLEKEKYVLYSVTVGAIIDFLLNLVFIPGAGAAGAAFATMIAEFVVLIVQIFYTKQLLWRIKNKLRVHIYLSIAVVSGIISFFIRQMEINSIFLILVVSAIVFFGIYVIGLLFAKEKIVWEVIDIVLRKMKRK